MSLFQGLGLYWTQPVSRMGGTLPGQYLESTFRPPLTRASRTHSVLSVYLLFVVYRSVMPISFVIPWTVACQAPLSMGFPRQEYWSVLLFPSLGDLPNPRMEPMSPALQTDSLPLSYLEAQFLS